MKNLRDLQVFGSEADRSQILLSLKDVSVGWEGRIVLSGVNLDIRRGDFITLTGPNGGGKTTLLRIILNLLQPSSGTVTRNLAGIRVGYLPQKNMVDSHFPITVREVIESGLLNVKNMSVSEKTQAYNRALDSVDLRAHENRTIGLLSGGQMQRALLARAIVSAPGLLVLDEPLSYIDNKFEEKLYPLIDSISKHATIVLVSHQMTHLAAMSTRHFIVDGKLHECHAHHHFVSSECC